MANLRRVQKNVLSFVVRKPGTTLLWVKSLALLITLLIFLRAHVCDGALIVSSGACLAHESELVCDGDTSVVKLSALLIKLRVFVVHLESRNV